MPDFVSSSEPEDSGRQDSQDHQHLPSLSDVEQIRRQVEAYVYSGSGTTDELSKDQPLDNRAEQLEQHLHKQLENQNTKDEQANKLRAFLFWIASILVMTTMTASTFLAIWVVVVKDQFSTPVIITFMSGLTIEALGLLYIIAQYLFPNGKK